jgi:hypothetical protein
LHPWWLQTVLDLTFCTAMDAGGVAQSWATTVGQISATSQLVEEEHGQPTSVVVLLALRENASGKAHMQVFSRRGV